MVTTRLGWRPADIVGPKYYAAATAFDEGDARAFHAHDGLIVNHLPPARDSSIDAALNDAGPDIYFADFGQVRGGPSWRDLLAGMGVMRGVGAGYGSVVLFAAPTGAGDRRGAH